MSFKNFPKPKHLQNEENQCQCPNWYIIVTAATLLNTCTNCMLMYSCSQSFIGSSQFELCLTSVFIRSAGTTEIDNCNQLLLYNLFARKFI